MKNAIEYWYPKIKNIVPTPRTIIIKAESVWDKTGNFKIVPKKYIKEIIKQSENFSFPIFLRGSHSSCKHSWKKTCYVKSKNLLERHIQSIANETEVLDVFGSVPITSFAIRKYIAMDTRFKYFWGNLPINPERRVFINNHKVICQHSYWTSESIQQGEFKNTLDNMNDISKTELNEIMDSAYKIAQKFKDYWSIDFCRAKNKKWYCIDMAVGDKSWHPKCKKEKK